MEEVSEMSAMGEPAETRSPFFTYSFCTTPEPEAWGRRPSAVLS